MQYRVSKVESIVGLFIFIALLIGAAFIIFNIKEGRLFTRRMTLLMLAEKGYGFAKGATVKVNGIVAGRVEEVKLDADNSVWLTLSINAPFYEHIHKDAVAEIIEPLAVGSPEINILPGSISEPLAEEGDFINARAGAGLMASFNKVEDMINKFSKTADEINNIAKNIEAITTKINKGEGSLGKMINDPGLYDSAKEAVDSTRSIVESIKSTRIYVGLDSGYYYHQDMTISRFHLKVVPRPNRYFWLGGTFFNPSPESSVTMNIDDQNYRVFPDLQVAQKFYDNRLTLRGGLLEGKFGGGIDFQPLPAVKDDFLLTIEGRDTYKDDDFNEHIDTTLVRVKARIKLLRYLHLEVGGNNLLDNPGFFVGIGFEYLDEDISKIVGLIGAGK